MEQTFFSGEVMKMCGTVPNMAHKSYLGADSALSFLSLFLISSFIGSTLGRFLLANHWELELGPLIEIVAGV